MATISDLLRNTITALQEVIKTFDASMDVAAREALIVKKLQDTVITTSAASAATIERYMTFMNENIFPKLSTENVLDDLHQLIPVIERLVVLVSDDGLSLEEALRMAQTAQVVAVTVAEEMKKPASFACVLSAGKRIWPLIARLLASLNCSGAAAVSVAGSSVAAAVSETAAAVVQHLEQPLSMEPPQPEPESVPAPPSLEGREAEPSPSASDNTDQKEESSN